MRVHIIFILVQGILLEFLGCFYTRKRLLYNKISTRFYCSYPIKFGFLKGFHGDQKLLERSMNYNFGVSINAKAYTFEI